MRFGKTFSAYQLCKSMKWSRILILTFKPAVVSGWKSDLLTHKDFQDWKFLKKKEFNLLKEYKKSDIVLCFGSLQDLMGKNKHGGVKIKNVEIHKTDWDCIIVYEYHYGAWRDSTKELIESEESEAKIFKNIQDCSMSMIDF